MDLSIVLVHYHTPALVVQAVGALRADLSRSNLTAQMILVDNGSRPEDRRRLQELGLEWIDPGGNTGYAGGVNRGVAAAKAPFVVVLNPDVLVRPGCLKALLAALDSGAAAAGPRFFWDRDERFLLPPTEPRARRWELTAALAPYTRNRARAARATWRRHARHAWLAEEAFETHELSGALLALRRDAFEQIGPFDEGYPLYFEETDWLLRLQSAGLPALHIPNARANHLDTRSAAAEPQSAAWFAQSQARFRRRHYGGLFARLVEAIERRAPIPKMGPKPFGAVQVGPGGAVDLPPINAPAWVEISPSPLGFPAAAERITERTRSVEGRRLPPELVEQVRGYWLRVD
jgi:GT2 family glycosyltransferase